MEGAIYNLVCEKVCEVLALCGIRNGNSEQLKEEIINISRIVTKIRLDAGIKGDLQSNEFVSGRVHRSTCVNSSVQKRKFDNLKGLTYPCKRQRKPSKPTLSAQNGTTPKSTAGTIGSSADVDNEVATYTAVDENGTEAVAEAAAVDVRVAVEGRGTSVAAVDSIVKNTSEIVESVSREVMMGSLQSPSQSAPLRSRTPGSMTENSTPGPANTQKEDQPNLLFSYILPTMENLFFPEHAIRVGTSVLLELVNRHDRIGMFGSRTEREMVTSTTSTTKIRAFTDQLAGLEYEAAVHAVSKRNARHAADGIQIDSDENAYWEIILKGVKSVDPAILPKGSPKGPVDGFSAAEKIATENFMKRAGFGTSAENQRMCRGFWKALFDIRKAGVEMITCYRTAEFTQYCRKYSRRSDISLVDTIVSWETVYGPQMHQLEDRVFEYRKGDFSGKSRLMQKHVAERVQAVDSSWNDASNEWYSRDEEAAFKIATTTKAASSKSLASLFSDRANTQHHWNKALFISLLAHGTKCLTVSPIIPVLPGDFLGIFSGTIRFSEIASNLHAVPGPEPKLWLDYSQYTGTLNQMQVSKHAADANVHLRWEAVNEQDETGSCDSWRVLVIASKAIMPFEPLIRVTPGSEPYLLPRTLKFAQRVLGALTRA